MYAATVHSKQMDTGSLVAIVGGIVAIATAFLTGWWQWLAGRRKADAEEKASLVSGFINLLASVQNERDRLLARIVDLEENNQKQDRRITKLERILVSNGVPVPEDL